MNIREEMWENCFLLKEKMRDRPSLTGDRPSLFSQNKVCPQLNVPQLKKQGLSPFLFF